MSYKGKLIRDRYVLFGSDLNEVTKDKINSACPTGDDIIRSLPPSSFMPVESKENSDEKKIPEKKIEKRKNRVKRKKEVAAKKKLVESILKEQTTIEKIISKGNEMTLSNDLDSLIDEAKPKQEEKAAVKSEPETITQEGSQDTMRSQILSMLASGSKRTFNGRNRFMEGSIWLERNSCNVLWRCRQLHLPPPNKG